MLLVSQLAASSYRLPPSSVTLSSRLLQAEKIMKALYVRKLFLWPRFQATVRATLEDEVPAPADVGLPQVPTALPHEYSTRFPVRDGLLTICSIGKICFRSFEEFACHRPAHHLLSRGLSPYRTFFQSADNLEIPGINHRHFLERQELCILELVKIELTLMMAFAVWSVDIAKNACRV